jgi:hypothetical protein
MDQTANVALIHSRVLTSQCSGPTRTASCARSPATAITVEACSSNRSRRVRYRNGTGCSVSTGSWRGWWSMTPAPPGKGSAGRTAQYGVITSTAPVHEYAQVAPGDKDPHTVG